MNWNKSETLLPTTTAVVYHQEKHSPLKKLEQEEKMELEEHRILLIGYVRTVFHLVSHVLALLAAWWLVRSRSWV